MKDLKNKEVITGLIIIIILGSVALFLLIKREFDGNNIYTDRRKENIHGEIDGKKEDASFFDSTITEKKEVVTETKVENQINEMDQGNSEVTGNGTENTNEIVPATTDTKAGKKDNKVNVTMFTLYSVLGNEKYKSFTVKKRSTDDGQMKELYEYWDAYRLDAVADLVRLERIKKISDELDDSNHFYYYGASDSLGRPSGKGLAIYQDNTYYFGDWKEGMRHGDGMWMQVAIYEDDFQYANLGVIEHIYSGEWKNDLPNGEGQEHFSYDYEILKEEYLADNFCVANVLGEFKDGYYHGEMYIMTTDEKGNTKDWSGECNKGSWIPVMVGKTTDAIWESHETDEQGKPSYHYILPANNKDYGVLGLMK